MILKYIILEKENTPVLFPNGHYMHANIAERFGDVISAGFCIIKNINNKCHVTCFGNSTTLKIAANAEKDKLILEDFLNPPVVETTKAVKT